MVLGLKPMGKLATSRKTQVLDRTKILHGSQTQTYGETSYFKKNPSTRQNQGLAWSSDSNLWGNQLLQENLSTRQNQGLAWSSDSNLWGDQLLQEESKYQTEPKSCTVFGLKPMGKLVTLKIQVLDRTKVLHGPRTQTYRETSYSKKNLSARQNQDLAWSSDSNLWGNQLLQEKSKYQTEPRFCTVLELKPMGKLATSR